MNGTDVEVLGWDPQRHDGLFVGSLCCAAEGREITKKLLDSGADVVLPVAGTNGGPGAEYAVKEHGSSYIIGVDIDWAIRDPNYANIILTSIVKNYDTSVLEAVQAIEDGTFSGGIHSGTLATGEVSLAPFHALDTIVSDKVKTELEQIRQKIVDGEINTTP